MRHSGSEAKTWRAQPDSVASGSFAGVSTVNEPLGASYSAIKFPVKKQRGATAAAAVQS